MRSLGRPQSAKYLLECSEYATFTWEIMSTIRRLVSSGKHSSLHRLPDSIWKIGICRRFAPITKRQELVLPSTNTASDVFQIIHPGTLAISTGLLSICGSMKNIQKTLSVLHGLVEQGNVLGIPDIRRAQVASTIIVPLLPPVPGASSESSSSLDLFSFF